LELIAQGKFGEAIRRGLLGGWWGGYLEGMEPGLNSMILIIIINIFNLSAAAQGWISV
jgi:hypothetical protein